MVAFLKLVFNDYKAAILIFRNQVNVEIPSRLLALCVGERKIKRFVQNLNVILKPFGEVGLATKKRNTEIV